MADDQKGGDSTGRDAALRSPLGMPVELKAKNLPFCETQRLNLPGLLLLY